MYHGRTTGQSVGMWKLVAGSALAVAIALGSVSVSSGQQPDVQIVGLDCNSDPEVVVIQNLGAETQDLTGWQLLSEPPASQVFDLFTVGVLPPGESLRIESGTNAGGLYKWATQFVFRDGDPSDYARIVDDEGTIVHEVDCIEAAALPPPVGVPNGGGLPPVDGSSSLGTMLVGASLAAAGLLTVAFSWLRAAMPSRRERTGEAAPLSNAEGRSRHADSRPARRSSLVVLVSLLGIVVALGVALRLGDWQRR
jgi:hypothetical protein